MTKASTDATIGRAPIQSFGTRDSSLNDGFPGSAAPAVALIPRTLRQARQVST